MKLRLEYNARNALKCRCRRFASYPGVIKELRKQQFPGVYCAKGESRAEVVRDGCDCPECEVYRDHGLKEEYYCIHGKGKPLYPDRKERIVVTHDEKAPLPAASS